MLEPNNVGSFHVCRIIEYMPSRLLLASETTPGQWTCLQESQSHRVSPLDLYSSAVKSCYKCPCGETEGQLRHSGVQKWIATLQLLLNVVPLWALGCFCSFCDEYNKKIKKINSTKSFLSFPSQKSTCVTNMNVKIDQGMNPRVLGSPSCLDPRSPRGERFEKGPPSFHKKVWRYNCWSCLEKSWINTDYFSGHTFDDGKVIFYIWPKPGTQILELYDWFIMRWLLVWWEWKFQSYLDLQVATQ